MGLANLIGEVLDDKYLIERELGKGGMGSVYSATHLGTDRPVAVKVIAPQFMRNDEFVERFTPGAFVGGIDEHAIDVENDCLDWHEGHVKPWMP